MGETTDQIETHIKSTRVDLASNLNELQDKVRSVTDWRQQFQKHPAVFMTAATVGGVLLSQLLRRSNRPAVTAGLLSDASIHRPAASQVQQNINEIKAALIGVAATQVKSFLSELIPGFEQHLQRTTARTNPQSLKI